MKSQSNKFQHLPFLVILTMGLVLRLIFGVEQGLSHDELSAWNRLGANNFSEILEFGVRPDMHPALVQILLQYWSNWFGTSEIALRLPGILAGITTLMLIYRLSLKHFDLQTGLVTTLLLSLPVFPVMHSTLARPYAFGILFIVIFIYGIFNLEDSRIKKQHFWSILMLVFGATGSLYTHYFAGFSCGIIGVLALFFVQYQRRWLLVLAGVVSVLLFLPHWSITAEQLARDGLGWLPPPRMPWLWDFALLFFNQSWLTTSLFLVFLAFGLAFSSPKSQWKSRFLWGSFFLVYIISHIVSHVYTPILREPGVFMLLPLLFLGISSHLKHLSDNLNFLLLTVFGLLILVPALHQRLYTKPIHFEPFKEISTWIIDQQNRHDTSQLIQFCNVTNQRYLEYYTEKTKSQLHFDMTLIEDIDEIHQMAKLIHETSKKKALLARINRSQNVIQLEILLNKFPEILEEKHYFNSNVLLAQHGKFEDRKFLKTLNISTNPKHFSTWKTDTTKEEFVGSLKIPVSELESADCYFLVRCDGWIDSTATALNFVTVAERDGEIMEKNEQPLLYQAWDQLQLVPKQGERIFFTAFELPKDLKSDDLIHIYFWNRNFAPVKINTPQIYAVPYPH